MPVRNNYADAKNEEAAIAIFFKTPSSILSKVPSLVSCQFFSQTSLLWRVPAPKCSQRGETFSKGEQLDKVEKILKGRADLIL